MKTNIIELKKIMVEKNSEKIVTLSKLTGITRNTLSNVLSGKTQPSAMVMHKLIDVLEISPGKAGEIFFN